MSDVLTVREAAEELKVSVQIIARPGQMRSLWHNIRPVPCPFCGHRIGPGHRCPHVVDFLLPAENGGEYGVVVEAMEGQDV